MTTPTTATMLQTEWQTWHAQREQALTTPHGWLSLSGFFWLPERPGRLGELPGEFWVQDGHGAVRATADDGYLLPAAEPGAPDIPVDATILAKVAEAGSMVWLLRGDMQIELVLRGGRYAIRLRDPGAAALAGFSGVPAFEVDETWIRSGTFAPFPAPRRIEVGTARADLRQDITGVGTVTVDIGGTGYQLIATAGAASTLNLAFHDATNGADTAEWRAVGTSTPDENGRLLVDFNRAVNFPYAFSEYGTCPAPPAGNTLPVPVTAGEKKPR